jgi:hypothetical protein
VHELGYNKSLNLWRLTGDDAKQYEYVQSWHGQKNIEMGCGSQLGRTTLNCYTTHPFNRNAQASTMSDQLAVLNNHEQLSVLCLYSVWYARAIDKVKRRDGQTKRYVGPRGASPQDWPEAAQTKEGTTICKSPTKNSKCQNDPTPPSNRLALLCLSR